MFLSPTLKWREYPREAEGGFNAEAKIYALDLGRPLGREQRQNVVGNPNDGSRVANRHRRPLELAHAGALVLRQVALLAQ